LIYFFVPRAEGAAVFMLANPDPRESPNPAESRRQG
jgi:hypothetical protein